MPELLILLLKLAVVAAGAAIGLALGLWAERYEASISRRDTEEEL